MPGLDFAVIGNCAVSSLVSTTGRHVWFCFPRLDAEPVFNALLGGMEPEHGFMDVQLRDQAGSRQRYLRNTAVLETILTDASGGGKRHFGKRAHRDHTSEAAKSSSRPASAARSRNE